MAKILIVEDNVLNMKLANFLLTNEGHATLCAVDAETGLAMAHADQPDLIVIDIQLPGMDGLSATLQLKRDPKTASIPIIALTAMAMNGDKARTRAAGCDAYIAKPLRYRELLLTVDQLLAKRIPPKIETGRLLGA
jgi:two-component system cell cycle response regulator DivK